MNALTRLAVAGLALTLLPTAASADVNDPELMSDEVVQQTIGLLKQDVGSLAGSFSLSGCEPANSDGEIPCTYTKDSSGAPSDGAEFVQVQLLYGAETSTLLAASRVSGIYTDGGKRLPLRFTVLAEVMLDDGIFVLVRDDDMAQNRSSVGRTPVPEEAGGSWFGEGNSYLAELLSAPPLPSGSPNASTVTRNRSPGTKHSTPEAPEADFAFWVAPGYLFSASPAKNLAGVGFAAIGMGFGAGLSYYYPVYTAEDGGARGYLPMYLLLGTPRLNAFVGYDFIESLLPSVDDLSPMSSYAVEVGAAWRPVKLLRLGGGWAWSTGANLPEGFRASVDLVFDLLD